MVAFKKYFLNNCNIYIWCDFLYGIEDIYLILMERVLELCNIIILFLNEVKEFKMIFLKLYSKFCLNWFGI